MDLAGSIRTAARALRRRPSDFFPFYMLSLAIPAITQVLTLIGVALLLAYLVSSGRLEAFRDELAALDDPPDPETNPEAFLEWGDQAADAVEPLISLPSIVLLLGTAAAILVLVFLLGAAIKAGQLATCEARIRGEDGMRGGIGGVRDHWLGMAGLLLLEMLLWILLTAVLGGFLWAVASVSVAAAVLVGILVVLVWVIGAILIRALFVFAPVALVVDDHSPIGAVRASGTYIRQDFAGAVSYMAIAIGALVVFSGISGSLTAVGAPTLVSIGSALVLVPGLDLLKTVLYGDHRGIVDPDPASGLGAREQLSGGVRRGIRELGQFVRDTPWHHAASAATLVIGFACGWILVGPATGELELSIGQRLSSLFPLTAPLYYFGNNWTVAISLGFAGVAAALPSLGILWFNGFVIAIAARLEANPAELLAFVVPHGIFEFPAIIIAGALGIYMGQAVWRTWRGRNDRDDLAGAFRRGFWVIIGVGLLLAIAAIIEGYVSPYYYQPFL